MSETWIILGATSSIARAFARDVAARGDAVLLAGRDMADLQAFAQDCTLRGARLAEAIATEVGLSLSSSLDSVRIGVVGVWGRLD